MKFFTVILTLLIAQSALAVTMTFEEKVRSIEEKGEKYQVTFYKKAAFYHVLKGSAQEKSVLPLLQEKLKSKEAVSLEVDPDTHEIMAVQK